MKRDRIDEYTEWVENRYNPGYWIGGRVPPSVKNLWSTKDRKWVGLGLTSIGAGTGLFVLYSSPPAVGAVAMLLICVPLTSIGVMMYFDLPKHRR